MEEFLEFIAKDNKKIAYKKWLPEGQPKAVLQISHGMAEHILRYSEFAKFMTSKGIAVYGNDHRGHGKTVMDEANGDFKKAKLGYFGPKNGWKLVLDDVKQLSDIICRDFPNVPLFIIGHSMGSFLLRAYIMSTDKLPKGVIISGTGDNKGALISAAKFLSSVISIFKGKEKQSEFLTGMTFKGFNDYFKPTKTDFDWLSRDDERNLNYKNDPLCGFSCATRFFFDLSCLIQFINNKNNIAKLPVDLPMRFMSGSKDPVGQFGKGVQNVFELYKNTGVKDINIQLYDNGRHEMLNETNRQEVYADIYNWIEQHLA